MADIPVVFPIKEIDWTDPNNPVVTELDLPFYLAYHIVGGKCALVEVSNLKPGFKLRNFINEKCDLKILKGSYIRKLTKDKSCTNHRNTWKKPLQSITGLGFTASNKTTFDSDTSTIEINADVALKNIKMTSLCALLWGVSTTAPDKISLVIDNKYSRSIRMYSLVGVKGKPTPSKSEIEQTKKDFFSQNQTSITPNSIATSLAPQNTANKSENHNQLYADILNRRKNIILEGPPGTGKTHAIKGIVEQLEKSKEDGGEGLEIGGRGKGKWAITMHPATSYEDFIEGLRPAEKSDEDAKSSFIYKPGVFLERVRDAIQNPHQQHVVLLDELNRSNVPRVLGDLLTTLEASKRTKPLFPTEILSEKHDSGSQEVKMLLVSLPKKPTAEDMKAKLLEDIDNPNDSKKNHNTQLKKQIDSVGGPTTKTKKDKLIQELKNSINDASSAKLKNLLAERIPEYPTGNSTSFRPIGEALEECGTDMESFEILLKDDDGENIKMNLRDLAKTSCERFIFGGENKGKKSENVLFVVIQNYALPVMNEELQKACFEKDEDRLENQKTVEILSDDGKITLDIEIERNFTEYGDNNSVFTGKIQFAAKSNHTCSKIEDYYWCNACEKRWDKKRTEVTLSGSKKKLHIPDNLLVVGTMNTTDRSVAPLDSALRRRFVFLRVDPQTGIFKKSKTKFQALSKDAKEYFNQAELNWNSLNIWLETNLGKDATIGHSYLFELIEQLSKAKDSIIEAKKYTKQMWQYSILPQVADLLDATGQAHALWDKNDKRAEKVIEYLQGIELELVTPDENINRTFSRTLVGPHEKSDDDKDNGSKLDDDDEKTSS